MSSSVSTARFRLLCRDVASRVNARRGRQDATKAAVLLELLRRVEGHVGQKPADLPKDTIDSTRSIREALDRLVVGWPDIAEDELLRKVSFRDDVSE